MLPPKDRLTICFAHVAYQLQERSWRARRGSRASSASASEFESRIGEADVLLVSGLWRNELLEKAGRLRFIQSISAGTDQYPRALLKARGIRLASAQGTNARAVAEHAMALILALTRRLPEARDHQARRHWRGMISDIGGRRRSWAARRSSSSDWADRRAAGPARQGLRSPRAGHPAGSRGRAQRRR
jgi:Phosphoglycerate dehydrogenase and related dehydrogenases